MISRAARPFSAVLLIKKFRARETELGGGNEVSVDRPLCLIERDVILYSHDPPDTVLFVLINS